MGVFAGQDQKAPDTLHHRMRLSHHWLLFPWTRTLSFLFGKKRLLGSFWIGHPGHWSVGNFHLHLGLHDE